MGTRNPTNLFGTIIVLCLFIGVFGFSYWNNSSQSELETAEPATANARTKSAPTAGAPTAGAPTQEQMALMVRHRSARQSSGWRQVTYPSVPGGIDIFRSGNMDIFRGRGGPFNFHIQSIDVPNFGVRYTDREDKEGKTYFASLRFCRRLSFMGNPKVDQLLADLESLPAVEPLSSHAVECGESQIDSGFEFSDLKVVDDEKGKRITGKITNQGKARVDSASFCLVPVDPERPDSVLGQYAFALQGLLPAVSQEFSVQIPQLEVEQPLVKCWLEYTAPTRLAGKAKSMVIQQNR